MRAAAVTAALPLLLLAHGSARAALCDDLTVPEGYTLVCETQVEGGRRSERAVVRPSSGAAAALAELTVRPLSREEAPLAWSDPARWLEDQVALDVSGLSTGLKGLSAAGPLAHPAAKATVDGLVTMLAGWGRLPLEGCAPAGPEAAEPGRRELRCRWGVEPLALDLNLRLVEALDARYAVSWWAVDEQRLRHLEAIANSFAPAT
jgi:hypothetical protein